VLKDPALKKYGEMRPDFTVNVPNLRILWPWQSARKSCL